jgi:hypothetical protein
MLTLKSRGLLSLTRIRADTSAASSSDRTHQFLHVRFPNLFSKTSNIEQTGVFNSGDDGQRLIAITVDSGADDVMGCIG